MLVGLSRLMERWNSLFVSNVDVFISFLYLSPAHGSKTCRHSCYLHTVESMVFDTGLKGSNTHVLEPFKHRKDKEVSLWEKHLPSNGYSSAQPKHLDRS